MDELALNVPLLRRRVPNLTVAARSVGLRPATVSDLCTGKIPVGRAEVRTLAALAALAATSLDELVMRQPVAGQIETGIKSVDLLAPLVRGGAVGCIARSGVGQLVLLAEIMRRLRERRNFFSLVWLPDDESISLRLFPSGPDLMSEANATSATEDEVKELVAAARLEQDVLLVADRRTVLSGQLFNVREALAEPGSRPFTVALFGAGDTPDAEGAPFGPLETLWRFDLDLFSRSLFPAIDPVASTSVLIESSQLEARHLTLSARARALLRRYKDLRLLLAVRGVDKLSPADRETLNRGERLEAFLTQPFFLTEPITSKQGAWVRLPETLDGVERILDGARDNWDVESMKYMGELNR